MFVKLSGKKAGSRTTRAARDRNAKSIEFSFPFCKVLAEQRFQKVIGEVHMDVGKLSQGLVCTGTIALIICTPACLLVCTSADQVECDSVVFLKVEKCVQ